MPDGDAGVAGEPRPFVARAAVLDEEGFSRRTRLADAVGDVSRGAQRNGPELAGQHFGDISPADEILEMAVDRGGCAAAVQMVSRTHQAVLPDAFANQGVDVREVEDHVAVFMAEGADDGVGPVDIGDLEIGNEDRIGGGAYAHRGIQTPALRPQSFGILAGVRACEEHVRGHGAAEAINRQIGEIVALPLQGGDRVNNQHPAGIATENPVRRIVGEIIVISRPRHRHHLSDRLGVIKRPERLVAEIVTDRTGIPVLAIAHIVAKAGDLVPGGREIDRIAGRGPRVIGELNENGQAAFGPGDRSRLDEVRAGRRALALALALALPSLPQIPRAADPRFPPRRAVAVVFRPICLNDAADLGFGKIEMLLQSGRRRLVGQGGHGHQRAPISREAGMVVGVVRWISDHGVTLDILRPGMVIVAENAELQRSSIRLRPAGDPAFRRVGCRLRGGGENQGKTGWNEES